MLKRQGHERIIEMGMRDIKKCKNEIMDKNIIKKSKFIGKGGQGVVYMYKSEKCGRVAYKVSNNSRETEREIEILKLTNAMVYSGECINYIYCYDWFQLNNKIYAIYEYANGSLKDWCNLEHSEKEWESMLVQIYMGISNLNNKLKIYHNDMKPKNILYKKTTMNKIQYEYNGKIYEVNNNGYIFMIGDYGMSQRIGSELNNMSDVAIESAITEGLDRYIMSRLVERIKVDIIEVKYGENLNKFIEDNKILENENYRKYYEIEKRKINAELINYSERVKNRMILRSLIYYGVENNILNVEDKRTPSKRITDILHNFMENNIESFESMNLIKRIK